MDSAFTFWKEPPRVLERLKIPGRGTVFYVESNRDFPEGARDPINWILFDEGSSWLVTGVERSAGPIRKGHKIGLVVQMFEQMVKTAAGSVFSTELMTARELKDAATESMAQAIFDWLNGPDDGTGRLSQPPYTYNPDAKDLTIGVDGELDCRKLAAAIEKRVFVDIATKFEPAQKIKGEIRNGIAVPVTAPHRK